MAVFAATGGGFDLLTFELDEIPIDTAETVESTAERISLVAGDETWEILGSDFTPVGEDVLPESGHHAHRRGGVDARGSVELREERGGGA